jgi:hypothetical protein
MDEHDQLIGLGRGRPPMWPLPVLLLGLLAGLSSETRAQQPVKSIGRVATPATAKTPQSVCESARAARERGSPAAANLDAQCRALLKSQPMSSDRLVPSRDVPKLQRVPDVVGMMYFDAESALGKEGYETKTTLLDQPDPSVPLGHVVATAPPAGRVQAGGVVEIKVPRAASDMGIGALSFKDTERRDGFDLDTLRYEQVFRGADITLQKYANKPVVDATGHTYFAGGGVYIEASDGAVVTGLDDWATPNRDGLASIGTYLECERQLNGAHRRFEIDSQLAKWGIVVFCVRTSKMQLAAISFIAADNPPHVENYKFRIALFPRQILVTRRSQPRLAPVSP